MKGYGEDDGGSDDGGGDVLLEGADYWSDLKG